MEYVDSLGRSRRCLREDLEEMRRRDKEMVTGSKPSEKRSKRYVFIGYTPRAGLLNHWATKLEVCNQLVL